MMLDTTRTTIALLTRLLAATDRAVTEGKAKSRTSDGLTDTRRFRSSTSIELSNTHRSNFLCKDIQSGTRQAGILVTGQI